MTTQALQKVDYSAFVIDSRGQARFVNHGMARDDKLFKQLQAL